MRDWAPEFSRRIPVGDIPARGADYEIGADAKEREALAARLGLLALESLTARLRLEPIGRGPLVRLSGAFTADVVQSCVVTLEPVPAHLEEGFHMTFGPEEEGEAPEIELSPEAEDPPDPFDQGAVDLGEAVAEQLALALDPFPRKPGAEFAAPAEESTAVPERPNPFAILGGLRKNDA
jgi:uncharacterized metal-binding protein YceD (DUF177 family)